MRRLSCSLSACALLLGPVVTAQVSWSVQAAARVTPHPAYTCSAFDDKRSRVLTFEQYASTSEIWELRGSARSRLATTPPGDVVGIGYDPVRDSLVAVRYDASLDVEETWEWDFATWSRTDTRSGSTVLGVTGNRLLFDATRQRLIRVAQPRVGPSYEVYEYVSGAWRARSTARIPDSRAVGGSWGIDQRGHVLLRFQPTQFGSVTYELDNAGVWTLRTSTGPTNGAHPLSFDAARRRFVLLGSQGETYEFAGASWSLRTTQSLAARDVPQLVDIGARVLAIGGTVAGLHQDSILAYAPTSPASSTSYGTSCGTPTLRPALHTRFAAWIGERAELEVSGIPANTPVLLVTGFSRRSWGTTPLPLELSALGVPGCWLYTRPDVLDVWPARIAYDVPATNSLVGLDVFHQVATIAPLHWSNAVWLRIGEP